MSNSRINANINISFVDERNAILCNKLTSNKDRHSYYIISYDSIKSIFLYTRYIEPAFYI